MRPKYTIGPPESQMCETEPKETQQTLRIAISIKKILTPTRPIRLNGFPHEKVAPLRLGSVRKVQMVEETRSPGIQSRGRGKLKAEEKLKVEEKLIADEVAEGEQMLRKISALLAHYTEKKARHLLSLVLSEGRDSESMARAWSTLSGKEHRHGFRYVAGYLLKKNYPRLCTRLVVCSCLHNIQPPAPEDVALVLEYIVHLELGRQKRLHRKRAASWLKEQEKAARLIDLALALLRIDYGGAFRLRQSTIYRLVRGACLKNVSRLYDGLRETNSMLTINTMLHFAERLSDRGTWTKAQSIMELVSKARDRNAYLPQVWDIFHTLFYNATFIGEEESSAVVQMMLDCSISPGRPAYNILMAKASRNQEEENLMQVFRQMTQAGLRPSMVTYGILHNHYKRRGLEAERSQVIRDALKLHPRLNLIIATDVVHASTLTSSHYLPVLDMYLKFFTPTILISLGMAMPEHDFNLKGGTPRKRLEPDHVTIAIMIHTFCMREGDPMAIWAAYQRYKKALEVERGCGYQGPLHEAGCFLPNSYMLALGCHDTLWHCAIIMEDMLKPGSLVLANMYSWSILLYAMAKARKIREAEQVLGAMRRKGIQPNVVTWTSLLTGYVRMGRLRNAGEVIRRMAAENVEPNYATMGLLASIIDDKEFVAGMMGETIREGGRIEDLFEVKGE